ncbi:MAG: hypothetical protein KAJ24_04355 [Candidatus Aenigmarchaeota archaeon]|nr:hypothetical protein [Candidatus Aenigmarchaeota archaeon]
MMNSKVVAALVLLLVVAFGGGITYVLESVSTGNVDNMFSGALDNPTGFVTKYLPSNDAQRDLRIYATLAFVQEPGLNIAISEPMDAFSIQYTDSDAMVSLGSLSINSPTETNMKFRNFDGRVSITGAGLSFSGTSGQILYDSGYISQERAITVRGSEIRYAMADLSGLPMTSFNLQNVTGTITVTENENKIVYSASDTAIKFDSFRGKIIMLSDNTIFIDGTGIFETDMILAPGN